MRMTEKQVLNAPTVYPVSHESGGKDRRYSVRPEFDGSSDGPRLVLRFCGEYIGSFRDLPAATLRAVGHKAVMNGAEIITEQLGLS